MGFYQVAAVSDTHPGGAPCFAKLDAHTSPALTTSSGKQANLTTTVPNHKLLVWASPVFSLLPPGAGSKDP